MPAVLEEVEVQELEAAYRFARSGPEECYGIIVSNDPINLTDPSGLIPIQDLWAKVETVMKPYAVGGGLLVTGAVIGGAGATATIAGFSSIPATGPAGAAAGAAGIVVTAAGVGMGTLGLDVYAPLCQHE